MSRRNVFEKHGRRIAREDARMPDAIRDVLSPPSAFAADRVKPKGSLPMTTTRSIRLDSTLDWGCEHTDADLAAYEQAVVDAIAQVYPGTRITVQSVQIASPRCVVTTRDTAGRILTDDATSRDEEDVAEGALAVAAEVWDRGEFWPLPSAE